MLAGGEENLIPMSERSKDEVREIGRKGGIASGEARREKAEFRRLANLILSLPTKNEEEKTMLNSIGINSNEDMTQTAVILAAAVEKAKKGDAYAREFLYETSGEKRTDIRFNGGVNINFDGESEIED